MLVSLPLILILILQGMSPSQAVLAVSAAGDHPSLRVAFHPKDAGTLSIQQVAPKSVRQKHSVLSEPADHTALWTQATREGSARDTNLGFGYSDRTRDGPAI
ncbi:MAG TPA: hypothetical protein VK171_12440 [Fimbriimonas sp.]|nr:hypothetical protein [Fimbriimonas sp.]